ncbi:MAG: hypothetical protein BWY72_01459 [Bacteroidetes bacterium ADurb.Bin416]|nr:MAG: hypothetical protein BWY72_01459 [Bacteroidetes bacterium ADurb.Bin416]
MIHPHGDDVAAFGQMGGQVVQVRDVPIGADTQGMSVDKDFTVVIDTFEIDVDAFAFEFGGQVEGLAVPSHTAGQVAGGTG